MNTKKAIICNLKQIIFLPKMPTITGIDHEQISFSGLETQITNDKVIRFIDAFVGKLELEQLGIKSLVQAKRNNRQSFF